MVSDFMDSGQNMQMYFYYEDAGPDQPKSGEKAVFCTETGPI